MRIEDLLKRLEGVRQSGKGYTARCPAHDDKKNSLSVSCGKGDRILIRCFAGCEVAQITTALGLKVADLMPPANYPPPNSETSYLLPIGAGDVVEHVRVDEPGGKRFLWKRNGEMGLGGLRVRDLPLYRPNKHGDENRVVICEGEKAAIAAGLLGLNAYGTVTGASSCPSVDVLRSVCKGRAVILWADNDKAGRAHMEKIRADLTSIVKSVRIVTTGGAKDDAADFRGTRAELEAVFNRLDNRVTLLADKIDPMIASLARYSRGDCSDRIPTGIKKIDFALRGGMMPGALYLVGAPSGHGKTTLLQVIGGQAARTRGSVLFVSPEMSGEELAEREAVREATVSVNQVAPWRHPNDKVCALGKLDDAGRKIKNERLPIYIVEDPNVTMADVAEIAANIEGIKLVIVDYAQEIADRTSTTARYLAVGEVGKDAITLGKKLEVPVLVASQVNVGKGDHGALEYGFRETKDLEHRAHCSMILEVKRSKVPNARGFFDVESARVFARKNRSGPVFSVDVEFNPAVFSIKDKPSVWAPPSQAEKEY